MNVDLFNSSASAGAGGPQNLSSIKNSSSNQAERQIDDKKLSMSQMTMLDFANIYSDNRSNENQAEPSFEQSHGRQETLPMIFSSNGQNEDSIVTFQRMSKARNSEQPSIMNLQSQNQILGMGANFPQYLQLPHNMDLVDAISQFQKYSNNAIINN